MDINYVIESSLHHLLWSIEQEETINITVNDNDSRVFPDSIFFDPDDDTPIVQYEDLPVFFR